MSKNALRAQHETEYEPKISLATLRQMASSPRHCAREIIAGLERGKMRLLVGRESRALHWISCLFPNGYGTLMRRKLDV
jgi:hypothetical protein